MTEASYPPPGSASTYDAVPYSSYPYPRAHPDRLAAVARLFGMAPALLPSARILELGCGAGGHLLPIAEQLPDATVVGVDLSARQIEEGRRAAQDAGLSNVRLVAGDLSEIGAGFGEFDYVICHGVYSWVAAPVRDTILRVSRARLAPQGVAYVSYNTNPGWHLRMAVRRMMGWHVKGIEDLGERTAQAGALIDFLANAIPDRADPWGALLRRELELLSRTPADYLFHEHLEEHNEPQYFHEFAAGLAGHGLQYLGDADVQTMLSWSLPPAAAATLERISPDLARLEQYMDFLRGRQFRSSLLCRADVTLRRDVGPERIEGCWLGVASVEPPTTRPSIDLAEGTPVRFEAEDAVSVSSDVALTKAALAELLHRAPDVVAHAELAGRAVLRLRRASSANADADADADAAPSAEAIAEADARVHDEARATLHADLLRCCLAGVVRVATHRPTFAATPGARPQVTPLSRWQAAHHDFVTSLRHVRVGLDAPAREVAVLCDGTRDRAAIVSALEDRVADGTLTISREGAPLSDRAAWREPLSELLAQVLARLAERACLVA